MLTSSELQGRKKKLSCELTNEPKLRQLSSENHYAGLRGTKDGKSSSEKKEYDCKGLFKHSYTKNLALVAYSSQEEYDWKRQMIKSTTSCVYKKPFTERLVKVKPSREFIIEVTKPHRHPQWEEKKGSIKMLV